MAKEDADYASFEVVMKESGHIVIRALGEPTEGCGNIDDAVKCVERRLREMGSQLLTDTAASD
jgi:hypothetical protein